MIRDGGSCSRLLFGLALLALAPGCASMRRNASSPELRPCTDSYVETADGWRLGVRHLKPERPDPSKLPVVLCHGLGLNGTFWTITDPRTHLPAQLVARGYEVFLFDFRGSGESSRVGPLGAVNAQLRQTPLPELGESRWNIDDVARFDVPAILDHVQRVTGKDRVNWIGHSLGGMLMFAYLEIATPSQRDRISNLVAMGSTIALDKSPQSDMLRANHGLRLLSHFASTGRLGRPLMVVRLPGLETIDQFYYSAANVDRTTVSRFYGYTLEDVGRGALRQLNPYLKSGRLVSADHAVDYVARLPDVKTPTLMIAGDGDVLSNIASTQITFNALGSADKTLLRFGRAEGCRDDYGHCDLVWSRHAAFEVFPPVIDWLDARQPRVTASPQTK